MIAVRMTAVVLLVTIPPVVVAMTISGLRLWRESSE